MFSKYTCNVNASSVSWTFRVKPNQLQCSTTYGKKQRARQQCLIISYLWAEMGKCGMFIPFHSHQAVPIPIPILIKMV